MTNKILEFVLDDARLFFKPVTDAYWWLNHRFNPRHRYNVVYTDLPPGYYDIDTVMLHSNMKLLCRYVEVEKGGIQFIKNDIEDLKAEDPEFGDMSEHIKFYEEVLAIYSWWKVERLVKEELRNALLNELYGDDSVSLEGGTLVFKPLDGARLALSNQYRDLDTQIPKDENEMLKRLIDIRQGLWT